jgi:hypothetical protein
MKKLLLATALAATATAAAASGPTDPIVVPQVIITEAESSSSFEGFLVPLMALIMFYALLSHKGPLHIGA